VLKIAQHLLAFSPRLFSIWLVLQLAIQCVLGGEEAPESTIIYWRFIGGFCPMGDNLGRSGQSRHFMQIVQDRINTGDCASR
jgi:hypothetical protein